MKTRHTVLLVLLALYALAGLSFGQTLRSLAYNTTNFTISGFTNTNALTLTNRLSVPSIASTNIGVTLSNHGFKLVGSNQPSAAALFSQSPGTNAEAFKIVDDYIQVFTNMVVSSPGPTNATNIVRWIAVLSGTNVYYLPLYQ